MSDPDQPSLRRAAMVEAAFQKIDSSRMRRTLADLVDIHSPTGAERRAIGFVAEAVEAAGFQVTRHDLGRSSGALAARLPGNGTGRSLMLYAPIDTHIDSDDPGELPWVGPDFRADMLPVAQVEQEGALVVGLGAANPKAMVVTILEAVRAVRDAGLDLESDLIVATAGGGMPWRRTGHDDAGLSSGISHLLRNGLAPDFGVIVKPWDEVYYEHPGFAWFRVTVHGALGYAGIPHGAPGFDSAIVPAARLVERLQMWLEAYPALHQTAQVRPEGWIGAIRSGWPDKPSFPAAACEIYLDIRTNPDQSIAALAEEFRSALELMAIEVGARVTCDLIAEIPAARTPPDHWIVQSALRAWRNCHDREYVDAPPMAGQTDAATIAGAGIPLVRIGLPFLGGEAVPAAYREGLGGMGVARIPDMIMTVRMLVTMIVDSCSRHRDDPAFGNDPIA